MTIPAKERRVWKRIFGPVASRRLGLSLGIDIIPRKTCTLDCVYCEVGRTTNQTVEVAPYIPADEILDEVESFFSSRDMKLDFVTITGSGEPTLHSDLGFIIRHIKQMSRLPLAVLTNGTLFSRESVREAVMEADLLVPSLDAALEQSFRNVNRPHPSLDLTRIIDGLVRLRNSFRNPIWLEILLVKGFNDAERDLEALRRAVTDIRPDRIQLNTVDRPPAVSGVHAVDREFLERCRSRMGDGAEIIASFKGDAERAAPGTSDEIIRMIRRRPCGLDEISTALSIPRDALAPVLDELVRSSQVSKRWHRGMSYYQAD
jgi:wyosine [tRNA(Phe)-imidazoG37] synthetase (radical SAM superfamily)